MARVKGALNARKRHKKVLKLARGYRGARSVRKFPDAFKKCDNRGETGGNSCCNNVLLCFFFLPEW